MEEEMPRKKREQDIAIFFVKVLKYHMLSNTSCFFYAVPLRIELAVTKNYRLRQILLKNRN